jgi:hypothetical protein
MQLRDIQTEKWGRLWHTELWSRVEQTHTHTHTLSSEIQTELKVSFAVFSAHKIQSHDHDTGSSPVIFFKIKLHRKISISNS